MAEVGMAESHRGVCSAPPATTTAQPCAPPVTASPCPPATTTLRPCAPLVTATLCPPVTTTPCPLVITTLRPRVPPATTPTLSLGNKPLQTQTQSSSVITLMGSVGRGFGQNTTGTTVSAAPCLRPRLRRAGRGGILWGHIAGSLLFVIRWSIYQVTAECSMCAYASLSDEKSPYHGPRARPAFSSH